ncbi:fibroin light chain-like [Trichoplusia ni]|uniref:Fibroin light chain-like n=1 Tax=Trichoplusia ni TaxID=7111 RepID=A0A7E5W904_TRINI|nr:fibroin light chain-like [Trichoplusia ni]
MLPVVLLLLAASALANPFGRVNQVSYDDVGSNSVIEGILDSVDGGDLTFNILTFEAIIKDLVSLPDPRSQALGFGQAIALVGSLATGIPGDACAAAQFIDNYVNGVRDGQSVFNFVNSLASQIDLVAQISSDSNALRFATGPRGNCNGGGRNYQFEAAWDLIFDSATPSQFNYINEQYCTAKRLKSSVNVNSNNAAAVITAVSLPVVNNILLNSLNEITAFAGAVGQGNARAAAGAAKQALLRAASSY